jgi:hypothetical protein
MMEGLLNHGTDVPIEANYGDTHGASVMWTSQASPPSCDFAFAFSSAT